MTHICNLRKLRHQVSQYLLNYYDIYTDVKTHKQGLDLMTINPVELRQTIAHLTCTLLRYLKGPPTRIDILMMTSYRSSR